MGEAGIGKTHVVAETSDRLAREGGQVFTSACVPLATRMPMFPLVDLLRDLHQREAGRVLESVLATCPGYVSQEVVRVVPELSHAGAAPAEAWQQQRLFAGLDAVWLLRIGLQRNVDRFVLAPLTPACVP